MDTTPLFVGGVEVTLPPYARIRRLQDWELRTPAAPREQHFVIYDERDVESDLFVDADSDGMSPQQLVSHWQQCAKNRFLSATRLAGMEKRALDHTALIFLRCATELERALNGAAPLATPTEAQK